LEAVRAEIARPRFRETLDAVALLDALEGEPEGRTRSARVSG
jgi:hypothetical protein